MLPFPLAIARPSGSGHMLDRTQRGAARVSAVWLIVLLVLLLAAMFFGYAAADGQAKAEERAAEASAAANAAATDLEERIGKTRLVSEILGYFNVDDLSATTDLELAQQGLDTFKSAIGPKADDTIKTFESSWPLAIQEISAHKEKIRTLEGQVTDLRNQVSAAQSAGRDASGELEKTIATLNQQLGDAVSNAIDEKNQLEATVARLRSEVQQKDADLLAMNTKLAETQTSAGLALGEAQSRINQLTVLTRPLREPQGFDGEILDTSPTLGLVYIDRGVRDRVVRGMRFKVIDGNQSRDTVVGEIEVTKVLENMSEARIISEADQFDPITPKDIITNPLYDPEGQRNAVLAGRFSGTYNQREIEVLLADVGIEVQSKLDRSTTFLIVGEALYTDPETGEAVEEPIPVSNLAIYKEAEAAGAQIVHISEIRHFFRR